MLKYETYSRAAQDYDGREAESEKRPSGRLGCDNEDIAAPLAFWTVAPLMTVMGLLDAIEPEMRSVPANT